MQFDFTITNLTDHELRLPYVKIPCSLHPKGQQGYQVTLDFDDFLLGQVGGLRKQFAYLVDEKYVDLTLHTSFECNPDAEVGEEFEVQMVPIPSIAGKVKDLLESTSLSKSEPGSMMDRVDSGLPVFGGDAPIQNRRKENADRENQRIKALAEERVSELLKEKEGDLKRTLIASFQQAVKDKAEAIVLAKETKKAKERAAEVEELALAPPASPPIEEDIPPEDLPIEESTIAPPSPPPMADIPKPKTRGKNKTASKSKSTVKGKTKQKRIYKKRTTS